MAGIAQPTVPAPVPQLQTLVPQSSFLALFEYDQQNLTLTSHLKSGAIYQHKFVLPADWTALQTSQNHGKHWSSQIKGKKLSVTVKKARSPRSGIIEQRRQK